MEYHLIINPAAGRGLAGKLLHDICNRACEVLGKVQIYETTCPGHACQISLELKHQDCVVIAVGGDGTVHEVVNGLVGGNCTLAVIPVGSGNDFVKMLHLPSDYKTAIDIIKRARMIWMDIGKVGDVYFLNGLGIGFDAEVVSESRKVKRLRGFLIYLYSVFKALLHYQNRTITLEVNGVREEREIFMITVGNGQCLGGGFYLAPGARIDDGLLDVYIFRNLNRWKVLWNLPKALNGKHVGLPEVQFFRTSHLIIESAEIIPVHADGELLWLNPQRMEVGILPRALPVIHNLENRDNVFNRDPAPPAVPDH